MCSSISVRILFRLARMRLDLVDLARDQRLVGVRLDQPRELGLLPVELLLLLAQVGRSSAWKMVSIRADLVGGEPQSFWNCASFHHGNAERLCRERGAASASSTTAASQPPAATSSLMRKPLK